MARSSATAASGIPDKPFFKIGETARLCGVKPYVLRYWETEFRSVKPQKTRSKQRLYRRRDIDIILLIKKLLYEQRFTIAGARKKLAELGVGRALEEGTLLVETNHRDRFRKLRDELQVIRALL